MHNSAFRLTSAVLAGCLLLPTVAGCGGDGWQRTTVSGNVTVGGTPLKAGRILFIPQSPTNGPVASAAVVDGAYTIAKKEGPVAGLHRVEVEAELPLGFALDDEAAFAQRGGVPLPPQPIPPQFNSQSQLTIEVQSGHNKYDVAVPAAVASVSGS